MCTYYTGNKLGPKFSAQSLWSINNWKDPYFSFFEFYWEWIYLSSDYKVYFNSKEFEISLLFFESSKIDFFINIPGKGEGLEKYGWTSLTSVVGGTCAYLPLSIK